MNQVYWLILVVLIHAKILCHAQGITVTKYNTVRIIRTKTVSTTTHFTTSRTIVYRTASGTFTEQVSTKPTATDPDFKTEILDVHNSLRKKHQVSSLVWAPELASRAQNFANSYVCNGQLEHSKLPYGENLALGYNTTSAVLAWYNEVKLYDFNNPQFAANTGHFTQLVWKNTSKLGCAFIRCGQYYGQYTVCEYDPPGNVIGKFSENVLPEK
ncbi:CAP domain-containing protein [Kluyveromyces lactis]|uniref:KLLA0D02420p n=1 Tax=Kluyveromyces lactis (strain ATCC 8585 / CBS 2359 / DSM 70799 / NBRC 1267 / NRRL Y-1140 / WM37) TaxID=284590 RepID=Q6CSB3_KLULA|nr:uncharacterized protein KLLA0_D02420g [Kluyveromyces lactis]CAH00272.1 KLLA0D02420p [Kluyveromyces lactis]|eukprot:XP_453176.1 uncharacterized protein KLLA0_D02420g [Kluyveromyces lactis]